MSITILDAVNSDNLKLAKKLIKLNPECIKNIDSLHNTPLLLACILNKKNAYNFVKLFIKHGCDIDARNKMDNNALLFAINSNNLKIVSFLCKNNININYIGKYEYSALALACSQNYDKIIKILIKYKVVVDDQSVINLFLNNNIKMGKFLLEKKGNINALDSNLNNLLIISCINNNIDAVTFLLKKNININYTNIKNETALMAACGTNNIKLVKLLLNNGANSEIKTLYNKKAINFTSDAKIISFLKKIMDNLFELKNYNLLLNLLEITQISTTHESSEECCICYENIADCRSICEHSFCIECYIRWFRKANTCAMCRTPFEKYTNDNTKYHYIFTNNKF